MKAALVVALAGLAAAQSLPDCASACLATALPQLGCSATDGACACQPAVQSQLASVAGPCLLSNCQASDIPMIQAAGSASCAQLATATSASATGSATGSAATSTGSASTNTASASTDTATSGPASTSASATGATSASATAASSDATSAASPSSSASGSSAPGSLPAIPQSSPSGSIMPSASSNGTLPNGTGTPTVTQTSTKAPGSSSSSQSGAKVSSTRTSNEATGPVVGFLAAVIAAFAAI